MRKPTNKIKDDAEAMETLAQAQPIIRNVVALAIYLSDKRTMRSDDERFTSSYEMADRFLESLDTDIQEQEQEQE